MRNRIYELHKNMIAVSAACSRKENTQETADDRKNATVTYNFATGDTVTIELDEGTEVAVYITERKRLAGSDITKDILIQAVIMGNGTLLWIRKRTSCIRKKKKEVCRKQRQQGKPWIRSVKNRKNW